MSTLLSPAAIACDLEVDETALAQIASQWIREIPYPATVFLHGTLGAGKTTFVRACLRGLGYQGHVKSPTYGWLESYELEERALHHIDLYRLQHPHQIESIGLRDCWQLPAWIFIEWPEKAEKHLPTAHFTVELKTGDAQATTRHLLICQHNSGR